MPNVDFDAANKNESILVPDGKYLCQVVDIEVKPTKTQKEMWSLHLQIENEGEFYKSRLFHNLVFGESSWWVIKEFYEAALNQPMTGSMECSTSDLMGKFVYVHVKGFKEYNGKKQPIIVGIEATQSEEQIPF